MDRHNLGIGQLATLCALAFSVIALAGCGGASVQPAAANPAPGEVLGDQFSQPAGDPAAGGQATTPAVQAPPNTTSAFGIPAGLTGSVDAGQVVFSNNCSACHSSLSPRNFSQLASAMNNIGAMRSIQLSYQVCDKMFSLQAH